VQATFIVCIKQTFELFHDNAAGTLLGSSTLIIYTIT
jgi:hypothetical protein